ncbi:MAG: hypothetical protein H6R06_867 [Proteobacteria bacterium]|jgi:hypothetical protein|nr:hypothetical protein [Pseudomonadota bacterium]
MHALANLVRAASICGIGLVLAGCSATRPPGPPGSLAATPCPKEKCDLEITIVGDCKKEGAIFVKPEYVSVSDQDNIMRWRIVTAGYEFDQRTGIDFSFFAPFQRLGSSDPTVFRVLNKNDEGTSDHKYDVNIKGCKRFDPWVRNTR